MNIVAARLGATAALKRPNPIIPTAIVAVVAARLGATTTMKKPNPVMTTITSNLHVAVASVAAATVGTTIVGVTAIRLHQITLIANAVAH